MTIPVTPQISLSPTSFSAAGQTITAAVSVKNRPAYHGKPKITGLTTITPKIVISRPPSGVIPFHVMVSAHETTCDAGSAYRDLHYEWNFGDSAGTEVFTDHYNGQSVNANDSQCGPEAAYIYRTEGTFTITLTVKGKDENGTLVTASTTSIKTIGTYFPWLGKGTGGTYTLTFNGQTTSPIAYNATIAVKQAAMEALSNLDSTTFLMITGQSYCFIGALTGDNTYTLTGDFSGITGATGTPSVLVELAPATYSVVTVSDLSSLTAMYVDSNYDGSNGVSNGTIERPYTLYSHIKDFLMINSNRVCYVKRGSSFTMSTRMEFSRNERTLRLLAYGTGAKPIFNLSGTGDFYWEQAWGTATYQNMRPGDFVVSNLNFVNNRNGAVFPSNASDNNSSHIHPYCRLDAIVIDSCDYLSAAVADCVLLAMGGVPGYGRGQSLSGIHLWGTTIDAGSADGSNIYTSATQWFSIVGCTISNGDGNLTLDHHLYISVTLHTLYRYISFQPGSKSYCVNGNCGLNGPTAMWVLHDGNDITGTKNGLDFSNSQNDNVNYVGYFDNVIVQFCKLHSGGVSPTEQNGILCYNLKNITIRDCDFWNNAQSHISSADTVHPTLASIYRCRFYDSFIFVRENQVWYFHDNVMATSLVEYCIYFVSGSTSVEQWDCDGNTYDSNTVDPFYNGSGSAYVTLATWRGYGNDTNGAEIDPGWSNPSNGVFIDGMTLAIDWGFTADTEYSLNGSDWSAYSTPVAIADTANRTLMYFRTNSPATNGAFTVTATSDATSPEVASESDSDVLIGNIARLFTIIAFGNSVVILQSE